MTKTGWLLVSLMGSPACAQDFFWSPILAIKAQSKLQDVELHGRVEDQQGQSVAGVEVAYDASGIYGAPGSGLGSVVSDDQGRFHVRGARGVDLKIVQMKKSGYQYRTMDGDADTAATNPQRFANGQWKRATQKNPAVFVVWKTDKPPILRQGMPRLYMVPGQSYTVDVSRGFDVQPTQGAPAAGDFQVLVQRSPTEWSVRLTGVDGGFQEQMGPYPFLAPEAGYAPVLEYKGSKQMQVDMERRLYFTSRQGKVYGYFRMHMGPYFNDAQTAIALWDFTLNVEGSRDLTTKPPP